MNQALALMEPDYSVDYVAIACADVLQDKSPNCEHYELMERSVGAGVGAAADWLSMGRPCSKDSFIAQCMFGGAPTLSLVPISALTVQELFTRGFDWAEALYEQRERLCGTEKHA